MIISCRRDLSAHAIRARCKVTMPQSNDNYLLLEDGEMEEESFPDGLFEFHRGRIDAQYDANITAPQLLSFSPLERTHTRCRNSALEIVTALHSALEKLNARFVFKRDWDSLKFKCDIPTRYGDVLVYIRVFSDNGEHIIEVQKRRSSSVGFYPIWKKLRDNTGLQCLQPQAKKEAYTAPHQAPHQAPHKAPHSCL